MSKLTILVVDDSSTVRTVVSRVLIEAGYNVVTAKNGLQALELAIMHEPDLAIIDIIMPEMDGYVVCERLKQMDTPLNDLPIIFLTCVKSRALELLGREYGAYLHKPVEPEDLLASIEHEFGRSEAQVD